jgi:hypothetical protein
MSGVIESIKGQCLEVIKDATSEADMIRGVNEIIRENLAPLVNKDLLRKIAVDVDSEANRLNLGNSLLKNRLKDLKANMPIIIGSVLRKNIDLDAINKIGISEPNKSGFKKKS